MIKRLRKYFGFYIDIPALVIVLVLVLLVHRPLANYVLAFLGPYQAEINFDKGVFAVITSITVNVLSAGIVAGLVFWAFRVNRRSDSVGAFKAFDLSGGEKKEWGTLRLRYNFFSDRIVGKMTHEDVELRLEVESLPVC